MPASRSERRVFTRSRRTAVGRYGFIFVLWLGLLAGCPSPPPSTSVTIIGLQLVTDNITSPLAMVVPPDGTNRKFIVDQIGKIYILDANGNRLATPFLDLSDRLITLMTDFDERGLLSLAFHPRFAVNGRFFVFYNAPPGPTAPDGFNTDVHVSEFHLAPGNLNQADPAGERMILVVSKPQFNHNGGQLVFGPDGFLYISIGDGGGANDVGLGHNPDIGNAQDKSNLLGKILRIDVDTMPDTAPPYSIPPDNPFVNTPNARPEIWAYGLRNPYRFSFDSGGTRRLFASDAGQDLFEEVDIIVRSGNYGWNIKEGTSCFNPADSLNPPPVCPNVGPDGSPLINPIIEYPDTDAQGNPVGVAVIGGYVYRGFALPNLVGQYLFGDFTRGFLAPDGSLFAAAEDLNGNWTVRQLQIANQPNNRLNRFVLGFAQDEQGEVYVLTSANLGPTGNTGRVFRIVPPP